MSHPSRKICLLACHYLYFTSIIVVIKITVMEETVLSVSEYSAICPRHSKGKKER